MSQKMLDEKVEEYKSVFLEISKEIIRAKSTEYTSINKVIEDAQSFANFYMKLEGKVIRDQKHEMKCKEERAVLYKDFKLIFETYGMETLSIIRLRYGLHDLCHYEKDSRKNAIDKAVMLNIIEPTSSLQTFYNLLPE